MILKYNLQNINMVILQKRGIFKMLVVGNDKKLQD